MSTPNALKAAQHINDYLCNAQYLDEGQVRNCLDAHGTINVEESAKVIDAAYAPWRKLVADLAAELRNSIILQEAVIQIAEDNSSPNVKSMAAQLAGSLALLERVAELQDTTQEPIEGPAL